ncbi:AAA family ATPase [Rhizobium laguerreae]|uniref:AAA family ATPase n=1 Tax=Rhizobium laguerreae TaxID=1076926 RepID=UPI001FE30D94|nr:AAA family ATPase [Rhizobium laguerreae]
MTTTATQTDDRPLSPGDRVTHSRYKEGSIEAVDGEVATISFDKDGSLRRIKTSFLRPSLTVRPAANDNTPPIADEIDAETLLGMEFSPVDYVVEGYVAEGLTILAGRPKLGKSWMALGFCIAVATGGQTLGVDCEQGDVLYLALEDNRRRLKDRLEVVLSPAQVRPNMARLSLRTQSKKLGGGLIEELDAWRRKAANPKLIVIDTLSMVRPPKKANQDSYAADYDAISPLQKYAGEHRLAVIVVHHVRKAEAEDPLEAVSGTNGLTGAADTIMVLNRTTDGPKLYGRGRDIEEIEKALRFDKGTWEVLGNAEEVKQSEQRRKILDILTDATTVLTPDEIGKMAGMKVNNVNYFLRALVKAGGVEKVGYGQYKIQGR